MNDLIRLTYVTNGKETKGITIKASTKKPTVIKMINDWLEAEL